MKSTTKTILKVLMVFGIIGLLLSLYLVENHYSSSEKSSSCDLSETVSCSLVNSSKYAQFFHTPVALLGVLWFFLFLILIKKAFKQDVFISLIHYWAVFGFLSILYFIWAEIQLKAICPFCTAVHTLILFSVILTFFIHRKQEQKPTAKESWKAARPWVFFVIVITLLFILFFNYYLPPKQQQEQTARCLTEKGVKFYGAYWCSHCAKQKQLFGSAVKYLDYVECSLPDRKQTSVCIDQNIKTYPTWIFADGTRLTGEQSLEILRSQAGCI
jgi:uncharacterized membrane protein/glutaredoxin